MRPIVLATGLTLLALAARSARATELITNGGFENGVYSSTIDSNTNPNVPVNWTPNAAFDSEPFNHLSSYAQSGSYSLQIGNYDTQPLASLSQTFSDVAGSSYSVSFGVLVGTGGDPDANFKAAIDGTPYVFISDNLTSYTVYTLATFSFVGTGVDTLTLSARDNPSEWFVDNVSVTGASAAVPEPAAWTVMLVGLGLAGAALRSARRRNAAAVAAI